MVFGCNPSMRYILFVDLIRNHSRVWRFHVEHFDCSTMAITKVIEQLGFNWIFILHGEYLDSLGSALSIVATIYLLYLFHSFSLAFTTSFVFVTWNCVGAAVDFRFFRCWFDFGGSNLKYRWYQYHRPRHVFLILDLHKRNCQDHLGLTEDLALEQPRSCFEPHPMLHIGADYDLGLSAIAGHRLAMIGVGSGSECSLAAPGRVIDHSSSCFSRFQWGLFLSLLRRRISLSSFAA